MTSLTSCRTSHIASAGDRIGPYVDVDDARNAPSHKGVKRQCAPRTMPPLRSRQAVAARALGTATYADRPFCSPLYEPRFRREARPAESLRTTAFTIAAPRPAPCHRVAGSHQGRLVPACPIAQERARGVARATACAERRGGGGPAPRRMPLSVVRHDRSPSCRPLAPGLRRLVYLGSP